jgi:hypothetical protein
MHLTTLTLVVRDGVEDLINVVRVLDLDFNRMRALQAIEVQGAEGVAGHEASPDVPLGEEVIDGLVADPSSETFIQPKHKN